MRLAAALHSTTLPAASNTSKPLVTALNTDARRWFEWRSASSARRRSVMSVTMVRVPA
jgi:hypothetical protein